MGREGSLTGEGWERRRAGPTGRCSPTPTEGQRHEAEEEEAWAKTQSSPGGAARGAPGEDSGSRASAADAATERSREAPAGPG